MLTIPALVVGIACGWGTYEVSHFLNNATVTAALELAAPTYQLLPIVQMGRLLLGVAAALCGLTVAVCWLWCYFAGANKYDQRAMGPSWLPAPK